MTTPEQTPFAPESWRVGQTVYVEAEDYGRRRGEPRLIEATIEKIGRKWATIRHGYYERRFHAASGYLDGGGYVSDNRVWTSREQHAAWREAVTEWEKLAERVRRSREPPLALTADKLRAWTAEIEAAFAADPEVDDE